MIGYINMDGVYKRITDTLHYLCCDFGICYEYNYCYGKISIRYGKNNNMKHELCIYPNEITNMNDCITWMIKTICRDCDIKMEDKMKELRITTNDSSSHLNYLKSEKLYFGVLEKPQRLVPEIEKVIFNEPATIVFWKDDTKTVVKAHNEEFDPEKGLAMAISKKALGNQGNYCNEINKWYDEYEKKVENVVEIKLNTEGMSKGLNEVLESLHQAFVKGLK